MTVKKSERKYPKTLILMAKGKAETRVHKRDVEHYESQGWKVVR